MKFHTFENVFICVIFNCLGLLRSPQTLSCKHDCYSFNSDLLNHLLFPLLLSPSSRPQVFSIIAQ